MNDSILAKLQRKILWLSTGLTVGLHLVAILALILLTDGSAESHYKPLATMDFAHYDPDGGEPGGGKRHKPEPEPEPEPTEIPDIVTSTSETAAPAPVTEKIKPKVKKVKPKPQSKPEKSEEVKPDSEPGDGQSEPGDGVGDDTGQTGTGQGGVGGGTGRGNPDAFNAYIAKIVAKLNRLKKYPPAMASKRIGGIVTVNFTIDRGGNVISFRMASGSGQPALDEETIALLKRCSPFPDMPKELSQTTINLTMPIQFKPPR